MNINSAVTFITSTVIICVCYRFISPDKFTSDFIKALCIVSIATFFISKAPLISLSPSEEIQHTIADTKSVSDNITNQFKKIISNNLPLDDNYD